MDTARTTEDTAFIIDDVEDCLIMGKTTLREVMTAVPEIKSKTTASRYIDIARRRMARRSRKFKNASAMKFIGNEMSTLNLIQKNAWEDYRKAALEHKARFLSVLIDILKRRAELLGLDKLRPQLVMELNKGMGRDEKTSDEDLEKLAATLKRIDHELTDNEEQPERVAEEGSITESPALRDGVPAAPHDGGGSEVPS